VPVEVSPATEDDLDAVVPLFGGYQRFYGQPSPDDARNRAFLSRFLHPSDHGLLLVAKDAGVVVGFANLYWTHSSVQAGDHAIMNDLFVADTARSGGVGRALIEASRAAARERGIERMSWSTAVDNERAQALYEKTGAKRSSWFEYDLPTG
jgi:ribosomal protein S18 acetylase RimI-like enzyme